MNLNDLPQYVVRTPSGDYALVPPPKEAYTLVYEYFRFPVDLENSTDVPNIPERFRYIIVDGAMYYAYLFRSNSQDAVLMRDKLEVQLEYFVTLNLLLKAGTAELKGLLNLILPMFLHMETLEYKGPANQELT